MSRFVVGDIHGGHKALLQCLERSGLDPKKDLLISLGDICDGWPEVDKVIEELLGIKHFKMILGNHDAWALRWMNDGWKGDEWVSQGGSATLESYQHDKERVPKIHLALLNEATPYLELDNKLFVHGDFNPSLDMNKQDIQLLMWDRDLFAEAVRTNKTNPDYRFGKWKDIFIGHTPSQMYKSLEPIHACNVWGLDTGGGWSGKLTLMDIDSHEYWQSDLVPALYPNVAGRG